MTKVKKYMKIMISIIIIVTLIGCTQGETDESPPVAPEVVLTISGSGSTTPILDAIKPAFEADRAGYGLEVLPGSGTGGGVKGVIYHALWVQGVLDVAAMARPPKEEEAAQNVQFVPFGQAGEAIITHPKVGLTNLTTAQLRAIFSGEVTNSSQIGGPTLPLILYVRDEGDSSTKALREAILGDTPFPESIAHVLTSQTDMLTAVEGTPGGVGLATWPTALAKGANVQALSVAGVAPNDSSYPMQVTLGIGYLTERQADVQPLIDWLLSERGQAALQEFDVITTQ